MSIAAAEALRTTSFEVLEAQAQIFHLPAVQAEKT
jgi:hypothetical protein